VNSSVQVTEKSADPVSPLTGDENPLTGLGTGPVTVGNGSVPGTAKPLTKPPRRLKREGALKDLHRLLLELGSIPTQNELAVRWGRPQTTVSDWLRKWRKEGLITANTDAVILHQPGHA
jgi:hypothetical protein